MSKYILRDINGRHSETDTKAFLISIHTETRKKGGLVSSRRNTRDLFLESMALNYNVWKSSKEFLNHSSVITAGLFSLKAFVMDKS